MTSTPFDQKKLKAELKIHAHALGIPVGAANDFIDHTIKNTTKTLKSKKIITNQDLKRVIIKELKKYHKDLAYVYENHDKII